VQRITIGAIAALRRGIGLFYATLNTDLDGQPRVEPKDTGADEYSTATIDRHPLQPADVGPNAT